MGALGADRRGAPADRGLGPDARRGPPRSRRRRAGDRADPAPARRAHPLGHLQPAEPAPGPAPVAPRPAHRFGAGLDGPAPATACALVDPGGALARRAADVPDRRERATVAVRPPPGGAAVVDPGPRPRARRGRPRRGRAVAAGLAARRLRHRPPAGRAPGRPRRRAAQRRRLAGAGGRRRADLGADAGPRRDRPRRAVRRGVLDLLPGVEVEGFWTALAVVLGLALVTTLVSSPSPSTTTLWFDQYDGPAGPAAPGGRRRPTSRGSSSSSSTASPGWCSSGPAAPATSRRCTAGCATAPTALTRLGDGLVVADRRQPVRHPPRLGRRHAGLPLGRQVDRDGRRLQPAGVGGRHRARPLRRPGPAGPPRLELRQPLLRRRRARRADDERRRPAQGGPRRRRLLRLLLPAPAGGPHLHRRRRRDRPGAPGGAPAAPPRRASRASTAAGSTPCCGRSPRSSAATSACRA